MYEYRAQVVAIVDGDTYDVDVDLGFETHARRRLRVAGHDAPELARPDGLGGRARGAVVAWLVEHPGPTVVRTVRDRTEKYGRYLVESLTAADGRELLADLVAAGHLKPYSGRGPKPSWP